MPISKDNKFSVKDWWALERGDCKELQTLAIYIHRLAPTSAATESGVLVLYLVQFAAARRPGSGNTDVVDDHQD